MDKLPKHFVYQQDTIDFVTVAARTCLFLEQAAEKSEKDFVGTAVKLLPFLYLKTSILELPESDPDSFTQPMVTEADYDYVRQQILAVIAADDMYLEIQTPEVPVADEPIQCSIAETLADVYQEIKNMAAAYQTGDEEVMNTAIAECLVAFREHWGQKLLNVLKALHMVWLNLQNEPDEVEDE